MDRPEQMEQQMWEFVYGLLPDDEAQAICAQVVADPDVARLYAEVKLRSELVAEASRLKASPVPLPIPSLARDHAGSRDRGRVAVAPRAAGPASVAAALRWAVTIAATMLVAFVGYAYFKPQSPLRPVVFQQQRQQLTEQPVHAALLAPSRLQSQPANHLAVMTRSLVGFARSTPVVYRLYGDGDRVLAESESQTDASGILQIETPAEITDRMVRLEVQTPEDGISAPLAYTFVVQPPELITHLSLDKPLCRPGETVRFRTVTLTRYDLRVDREIAVAVEMTDEDGNLLEEASHQAETENGVSHGQLEIPDDLADGMYRVVARSPTGCFAEVSHPLAVRDRAPPRFRKRLLFDRESYGPGDRVVARLTVLRAEGGVLADAPLWIEAVVDSQVLLDESCSTDQQGACEVTFALPDQMDRGQGSLTISVEDTETDVLSERIPIQLDAFSVDFFPESGALVAGVQNRVYFRSSWPIGSCCRTDRRRCRSVPGGYPDGARRARDVRTDPRTGPALPLGNRCACPGGILSRSATGRPAALGGAGRWSGSFPGRKRFGRRDSFDQLLASLGHHRDLPRRCGRPTDCGTRPIPEVGERTQLRILSGRAADC